MDAYFNTIGIVGVTLILTGYFLLQAERVTPRTPRYLWLNLIGAISIMVSLIRFWNLPSFVIECAWSAISIYGLLKTYRRVQ